LFDVHAAIAWHRTAAGPDAERFSEIWRVKQLEYAWAQMPQEYPHQPPVHTVSELSALPSLVL
jgi:hypothetical protein